MLEQFTQKIRGARARRQQRRRIALVKHTVPDEQPFALRVRRRRWWPPFYATAFFLPRLRVVVQNEGDDLPNEVAIELRVMPYTGSMEGAPGPNDRGWREAATEIVWSDWRSKQTRGFKLGIPSSALPAAQTYIVSIAIVVFRPGGFKAEPGSSRLVPTNDISSGVPADRWVLNDYFRVEPLSSVLTFFLVAVTFLLVLATLALALAP